MKIGEAITGMFRKADNDKEVGASGFRVYGGYITTNEKDRRLVGSEKWRTYGNVIANCTIVSAGVRYYLNLVSGVPWKVIAADDSEEAIANADAMDKIIRSMEQSWESVVRRAAMYRYQGFSVQEWTTRRNSDGAIGLKSIKARPQSTIERWDVDSNGNVRGMWQRVPQSGNEVFLPRSKVIYIVDDAIDDNPEGMGIFRHIVDNATELKRLEQLEMYGYESDLRGVPMARIPYSEINADPNLSDDQKRALVAQMETIIENHIKADPNSGITMDSAAYESLTDTGQTVSNIPKWDFKLLEGSSQGLEEVAAAIDRKNHEIARVLGVEHLLLGQRSGSRSLSEDKSNNFAQIVNGSLVELAHTFQRDVIEPVSALNGWAEDKMPRVEPEKLRGNDAEKVGALLRDLAVAGAPLSAGDSAIDEARGMMGLSPQGAIDESDVMLDMDSNMDGEE